MNTAQYSNTRVTAYRYCSEKDRETEVYGTGGKSPVSTCKQGIGSCV